MHILQLPENDFIKKINRVIFNSIWNKHDRFKRNTLIGKNRRRRDRCDRHRTLVKSTESIID